MFDRRTIFLGLTAATIGARARGAATRHVTPQEMLGPFYPEHPSPIMTSTSRASTAIATVRKAK